MATGDGQRAQRGAHRWGPTDPPRPGVDDRRAFLRLLGLGGGALLVGCQAPAATAPPASSASAAGSAAAPATSSASPSTAAAPGRQAEWDALVEAAKREGSLVVSLLPTAEVRTQSPTAFKRRFGIDVEYLGGRTGDLMTRLQAERAAEQYTVDAMIAGATTLYYQAYPGHARSAAARSIHPGGDRPRRLAAGAPPGTWIPSSSTSSACPIR